VANGNIAKGDTVLDVGSGMIEQSRRDLDRLEQQARA
jgi:hypothetical protein